MFFKLSKNISGGFKVGFLRVLPFGIFSEFVFFSTSLNFSTNLGLISRLISCPCSEWTTISTRTFV
jgi:hypothetical protein